MLEQQAVPRQRVGHTAQARAIRTDAAPACRASTAAGFGNDIGSLPGNKASVNDGTPAINYYETNNIWVWVPIWDTANGNGSNGYYHIVGYSAFETRPHQGQQGHRGGRPAQLLTLPPASRTTHPTRDLLLNFSGDIQLVR